MCCLCRLRVSPEMNHRPVKCVTALLVNARVQLIVSLLLYVNLSCHMLNLLCD